MHQVEVVKATLLNKSCSNKKINALCYSNFKIFRDKISRIFIEKFYIGPSSAVRKGQYRPWARLERPGGGLIWVGISLVSSHRKLPCNQHQNLRLPMQIMVTLFEGLHPFLIDGNVRTEKRSRGRQANWAKKCKISGFISLV